ncbi:hypothetical protein ACOSQ2_026993 [Xanthoceras sorbifolium]
MHTLKAYVRNKAHPEGLIAEGYTDHECLNFYSMYFRGIETRFNRPERNYDGDQANQMKHLSVVKLTVRLLGAAIQDELTLFDWVKIRWYVLNNCDEVSHLQKEGSVGVTEDLKILSNGPEKLVTRYTGYRDCNQRTQNCGVLVKGEHGGKSIDFYGVLKDIIAVPYLGENKVVIFKCDCVNIRNIWYKNDPFVLACQTQQVFYLNNIKLGDDWRVIDKSQPRGNYDDIDDDMLCRNDMGTIDVDVNVKDQNDAIDNFVDDNSVR